MSTTVYPYLPHKKLKQAEDESAAKELSWLLDSLSETFSSLKNGLEECQALFSPVNQGSTLVLSSPRSEFIKGHVTRVGSTLIKGTLNLRLRTHQPLNISISPKNIARDIAVQGLSLPSLTALRKLLEQSLNCLDSTQISGSSVDATTTIPNATFLFSQLKILHSLFQESLTILKGSNNSTPSNISAVPQFQPKAWYAESTQDISFIPELPSTLALDFGINDCSLLLTIRVLEPCSQIPILSSRFLAGIGAQRRLEHDEMNNEFIYRGELVRVKEKCRVESSADPCLLGCAAKLQALERSVLGAMEALKAFISCGEYESEG